MSVVQCDAGKSRSMGSAALKSPEGLLVGLSHAPWLRGEGKRP
jgi:hypothetical protein